MLVKIGLGLVVVLVSAMPALAQNQSCGGQPFAPALVSPAEIAAKSAADAHTALHDAFTDVKNWQGDLKTYRACLDARDSADKREIAGADPKKDADKIKQAGDEVKDSAHSYDASVDAEEKVVNEFHAAQAAYCLRTDVDRAVCPK